MRSRSTGGLRDASLRADRKRQSMAIHYRHDFHVFSALYRSNTAPASRMSRPIIFIHCREGHGFGDL
jgi:hypothetical protein